MKNLRRTHHFISSVFSVILLSPSPPKKERKKNKSREVFANWV
jgi:hypothetical protein